MKKLYYPILIIILISTFISCQKKDDTYYNLSREGKSFLVYEEGETFRLRNEITEDTITFTINSKSFIFEENNVPSAYIAFGIPSDSYFEIGTILFNGGEDCFGEIISVAGKGQDFSFYINLGGCFENQSFTDPQFQGDIEINGVLFNDTYRLSSGLVTMYYSKEKGILSIIDVFNLSINYSIVE